MNGEEEDILGKIAEASSLRQILGAMVFASPVPLSVQTIRKTLQSISEKHPEAGAYGDVSAYDIKAALEDIAKDLRRIPFGMDLVEIAGAWRFQTQPGCGKWVRAMLKEDKPAGLSQSQLETLAIVAYRQPISRSEIESIRGVGVDHTIRALAEMRLVKVSGRSDLPGHPFLYVTTSRFLEKLGLRSIEELYDLDPALLRGGAKPVQEELKGLE